jgi:2',3'-cyclic-nucleotide 2'-phosphodiesterase/3'-nucleotidase
LAILLCALVLNAQEVRVQVLASTDVHGHILPEDAFTLQPANQGWARLATLIRAQKALNPNTVLVDCGDATQGEPIDYVWSHLKSELPEPSTAILNSLGCQAMVVGNHEFDAGFRKLKAMEEQAQYPWLGANVVFAATGKRAFTPYLVTEVGGVRVAILGLTTAAMARLAEESNIKGLVFQDAVATAKTLVPMLRDKEKADLVVVALHGGLGKLPCGPGDENQALGLAEQVPGIDLILTGHTHQQLNVTHNGVPILQAGVNGQALAQAEFGFHRNRNRWEKVAQSTKLLQPAADAAPDPAALQVTEALRAATSTYLNTFATNLGTDLDGRWTRMEDTPLMDLMHTVAREAAGAQVSALATPGAKIFIPRGQTSVRQFYALYPYDNHLARIRVTGRQLRAYLEHAARFFNLSHQPDLFNRAVPAYNYDTLGGCSYVLDISRPAGARVVDLKIQGQPVKDAQSYTLAITSYRLAGGGGYLEAMGWEGKPEFVAEPLIRNLILGHVLARPTLNPAAGDHWRIVPALDRDRVLAQQP